MIAKRTRRGVVGDGIDFWELEPEQEEEDDKGKEERQEEMLLAVQNLTGLPELDSSSDRDKAMSA